MISKLLIAAVIFLCLLAAIVVIAKMLWKPKAPITPEPSIADMTHQELLLARADLTIKSRALTNKKELARIRAQLADVEKALTEVDKTPVHGNKI